MADDTTQAGNATIRADDVAASGKLTQVFRHDIGGEAEAELLGLGDSLIITGTSGGLTLASPGTAYTAGDVLGTEITFAGITRTGKGATIQSATLLDKSKIIGAVDLFLFNAASTPAADNAANSWTDPDILKCLGVIHFTDGLVSAINTILLPSNLPMVVKPASGVDIKAVLVTRAAHTYFGAVGDLVVNLGVIRD